MWRSSFYRSDEKHLVESFSIFDCLFVHKSVVHFFGKQNTDVNTKCNYILVIKVPPPQTTPFQSQSPNIEIEREQVNN